MSSLNGSSIRPITDLGAWLADHGEYAALRALGELLLGVTSSEVRAESGDQLTLRHLGVSTSAELVDEELALNAVTRVTAALALAELIAEHAAEVGSGEFSNPPSYTQAEIALGEHRRHPQTLRAAFPAGTVSPKAAVVIRIETRASSVHDPALTVYATRANQLAAQQVLDRVMERADELNPFRGRAVRATFGRGVQFSMIDLPPLSRATVVVPQEVWAEVDLGVRAVRDQHELLNAHGLGCRRGVLLVGPPGTGKSAVSAVVARELLTSGFTVIYVEAKAGQHLLTAVVEEAQRLGGPILLVLEDVDLYVRNRSSGDGGGLSELLQAMDISPDARILTIASTNDGATLDAAAIRTGRFDSIVTVSYPDRESAAAILAALVDGIPGEVDTVAVAGRLPDQTSGSDLREVVRRAVLSGDGTVSTAGLLSEIGSGRYRATVPAAGQYL
ncbi:cell division protease ftsH-like protein [Mycobacteroides abscessus subsp. abscessus]|uniref:AAA family ATPase n=1 Tax=Mycobacteroides abscessus TaxID=36809 RepID=UPI00092706C6|nr:ATP-binding protein [Mycobacteroides abscessus]SHP29353.1 cell division protease ftsH-like protein [Mycobacteroides abscessus subsp. abscessus]SHP69750.1 cell division protease ftsH-like protein [Mycobacteroides abscessus subsp. abscessus]SHY39693.1 cell division protease ftsH-like protein [Mycobacteroides abscessus subsp. abscessus]SKD92764.1 cell division protease ftsH-like protein [Mycobacteroides abscessus subsp. abscessus]